MSAPGVIEALDVLEHVGLGLVPRPVRLAGRSLGFQRGEEALHRRIIPDIARPAHGAGDAVVGHQPLELLAGILTATVRMMQERTGLASAPDRIAGVARIRGWRWRGW